MELVPTEVAADLLCRVKLFTPDVGYTLWATEYDQSQRLLFGCIRNGGDGELGFVSLDELESVRGPFGFPMERELYFAPMRLSDVRRAKEEDVT